MGPTNVALVKLFEADQKYRQAQARLDAASRDVRIQERKVLDLQAKHDLSNAQLRESQAKAANAELDIKTRDSKIERLRTQQQTTKNNKEYQAFLVQINTEKVDKAKVEDELLKLMEQVEKLLAETKQLAAQLETERQKHQAMQSQITQKVTELKLEVDSLKPARDAAAANVPPRVLEQFEKLSDRFDGEALAAIGKPDRRVEEYACSACNMSMAVDIYNRLHLRDEAMFCPSCRRFLYIPDDLPPEQAIHQKKKRKQEEKADVGADIPATPDAAEKPADCPPATTQA